MKINVKNMPKLKLSDLLRRRKMTLQQFLNEFGITTHEGLSLRCARMGILPPDASEFETLFPSSKAVNSPQEGVVVIETNTVVSERPVEVDQLQHTMDALHSGNFDSDFASKKNKKRKFQTGESSHSFEPTRVNTESLKSDKVD